MNLFSNLTLVDATNAGAISSALTSMYFSIAIIMIAMGFSSIMEGIVVSTALKGMSRNPEASKNLRTSMILGCALCETVAIYGLVIAIMLMFVSNPGQLIK